MKLIIFNGPPRSGKNTMLSLLMDAVEVGICPNSVLPFSYKWVLCEGVAKRYNLSPLEVWNLNDNTDTKDLPDERFNGLSVRQALIYESEDVIKVELGKDGVADKTFENLKLEHGEKLLRSVLATPDGGFDNEMDAFQRFFWVPREDILLVRMLRDGHDYTGDSRNYIPNPDLIIENNGDKKDLRRHLHPLIQFVKQPKFADFIKETTNLLDGLDVYRKQQLDNPDKFWEWHTGTLP